MDGFGLTVGTTTTGEPGSDAAVEIQKNGTKYTANFTIPRGDKGADGVNENVPLGSTSGVVAHATDAYPTLPRKVQVHGQTVENLWPSVNMSQINDWTCTTDETGLMHVATTTATTTVAYFMAPISLVPGKTYAGIVSNGSPKSVKIRVQCTIGGSHSVIGAAFDADGTVLTVPGDATDIIYCVACEPTESVSVDYKTRVMLVEGDTVPDVFVPAGVNTVKPEKLVVYGKSEQENKSKVNLPSGISLADGDTLTIARDGTTQITHAEGEPTVLESVTLPELPAPTFNVHTTGGYIPPTVDVDYERDVNLVLEALEAKIAALQVADKTN